MKYNSSEPGRYSDLEKASAPEESLNLSIWRKTKDALCEKWNIGKNFYRTNQGIRITENSNTFRVITADRLEG